MKQRKLVQIKYSHLAWYFCMIMTGILFDIYFSSGKETWYLIFVMIFFILGLLINHNKRISDLLDYEKEYKEVKHV